MANYSAKYWQDELDRYREDYKKFAESGKKIIARFRDERKESQSTGAKFNILWSNHKTLKPAVYSRPPKIEVSRRFKDQNDVARVASMILERVIDYEVHQFNDYNSALSSAVDDRLLVGRGVAWIRYEPQTEEIEDEEAMLSEDAEEGDANYDNETNQLAGNEEPLERITTEHTPVDYVFWQDFAHLPARSWEEVTWVARRVFLSQEEGRERFGDVFMEVPLTHSPDKKDEERASTNSLKKAVVWEIWCKSSKTVYWVAEHFDQILDEKEDPLNLEGFFPCPKPIFATVTTDSLIPVADFKLYQDQADEIDEITSRIQHLTKAMKVMGIYAADEPALSRLLKEGNDAIMIPVENWQSFAEKGGLGGAVQFMPLRDVVLALQQLYAARDSAKQIVYETTGISDILRGASMASETATAQQIKSQFASIRLNDMKDDVARFARDLLRMKAEIICDKYQPEIILQISGIAYTPDAQFAPQAIALLKNEPMRNFQIDIQSDTLVQLDEQSEKQARVEFLTAASEFLQKTLPVAQAAPETQPLLLSMLLFGVRGFKVGRDLEGEFEKFSDAMKQKAENPQPPQPNPEMLKLQAAQQAQQAQIQAEQMRLQMEQQFKQSDLQLQQQAEQSKAQFEQWKAQLEAQTKMQIAQLQEQTKLQIEAMRQSNDESVVELDGSRKPSGALQSVVESSSNAVAQMVQAVQASNEQQTQVIAQLMEQMNRPRQVVRGDDGKIIGVQ